MREKDGERAVTRIMRAKLGDGERLDDLGIKGYQIIQKKDGFCFGMDAVLLSSFVKVKKNGNVLDLGTGTGILPILMEAKTPGRHFTGLEIQSEMAGMAARSAALNGLEEKIEIVEGDITKASAIFSHDSFDVVTSNPPYIWCMIMASGIQMMRKPLQDMRSCADSGIFPVLPESF